MKNRTKPPEKGPSARILYEKSYKTSYRGDFVRKGPKGTGGYMESLGLKPGVTVAVLVGLMELVGGLLFTFGFLTVLGSVLIIIPMLGAITKVHWSNGYWGSANGYEMNLLIIAVAVAIALTGAGAYSLDAVTFN